MKISFWHNNVALAGQDIYKAFEHTVLKTDQVTHDDMDADAAVIWSVLWDGRMRANQKVYDHYRKQNKPVVIIEVGVLRRNQSWRISVNHIDNTGYYGHLDHDIIPGRSERFNLVLKDFQGQGNKVVVCCQNQYSQLWRNMPVTEVWLEQIVDKIKLSCPGKQIVVRPHPRYTIHRSIHSKYEVGVANKKGTSDDTDFLDILDDAYCVISPTGGSAVEAIINGVPAMVEPESLASTVASTDYSLVTPLDSVRQDWFNRILNTEWFIDEIHEGEPWCRIRQYLLNQILNH